MVKIKFKNLVNILGIGWVVIVLLAGPKLLNISTGKTTEIDEMLSQLDATQEDTKRLERELKIVEKEIEEVEKARDLIIPGTGKIEIDLHLPSVIISIEDQAENLDLEMEFSYMAGVELEAEPEEPGEEPEEPGEEPGEEPERGSLRYETLSFVVEGTYSNVTDFIKYLDELDFIEPSRTHLTSKGDKVKTEIEIHVYYGGV